MAAGFKEYALKDSFTGGEFSPRLFGQIRLKNYPSACATLENWIIYPQGPAHTRPGFLWIAETKDSGSKASILRSFTPTNLINYILEWGEEYIRFYKDLIQIHSGGIPYEVATPYLEADLPYLRFAQSFDIQYIVRRSWPVGKLSHFSDTSWKYDAVDFIDGPYRDINVDGTTYIQPSAISGSGVTLTATGRDVATDIGTYNGTTNTPAGAFAGGSTAYVGFRFAAPASMQLNTATLIVAVGPASGDISVSAELYADFAGSPSGSSLASASAQTIAKSETGAFTWTFSTKPTLTVSTHYWVVFYAASTDAAITLATVNHNTSYGSGVASSAAGITDSMSVSWNCDLNINTLGSSPVLFYPGHVGSLWRLKHPGQTSSYTFSAVGEVSSALLLRGKFSVDATSVTPMPSGSTYTPDSYFTGEVVLQSSTDSTNWLDVASFFYSTTQTFVESNSNVYYRLYCKQCTAGQMFVTITQAEQWGTIQITSYVSGSQVVGTVLFPFASTASTSLWREGAWSYYRGYPEAACFHDNRLWFGRDIYIWASWVGDYENFNPDGDTDDAALTFSPSQLESALVWMESTSKGLMLGAISQEGRIWGGTTDKPITPTSVQCQIQETIGAAQYPEPLKIGQAVLFVQLDRRRIRELVYDFANDGFKAPDLSIRSEHLTVGGLFDIAYQQFPNSIVWLARGDGTLIGMTYFRDEDVVGWHRHSTQGTVESVAVKSSSVGIDAGYDELWVIVNRTINGSTKRYVEVMANHEPTASGTRQTSEFLSLDCAYVHTYASPTDTITGLTWLAGETVSAVGDGIPLGSVTVDGSGNLTLPVEASIVHIGFPYTCTLTTMPIEVSDRYGYTVGRDKQSYRLILRLFESIGGQYGSDPLGTLYDIPYPPANILGQTVLYTGLLNCSYSSNSPDAQVSIVQADPLPLTLTSLGLALEVNEA